MKIYPSDVNFEKLKKFSGSAEISYLHTLLVASKKNQQALSTLISELDPHKSEFNSTVSTGTTVSSKHSVVAILPDGFCDSSKFFQQYFEDKMEFMTIHNDLNAASAEEHCKVLKSETIQDVKITRAIEDVWLARKLNIVEGIISTYLITESGMMRIFPGVAIKSRNLLNIYDNEWYLTALASAGLLTAMASFTSYKPPQRSITLSQTIIRGNIHCSDANRMVCTEKGVMVVVAIDVYHSHLQRQFMNSLKESAEDKDRACGESYKCSYRGWQSYCVTECHLVDQTGEFLLVSEEEISKKEHLTLYNKFPFVFNKLLNLKVFRKKQYLDTNSNCFDDETTIEDDYDYDSDKSESIMGNTATGPVPDYEPQHDCVRETINYVDNRTRLLELGGIISGHFKQNPCFVGYFFFSVIPDTNMYLFVVEGYKDLSTNPLNIICHLSIKALSTYRKPFNISQSRCKLLKTEIDQHKMSTSACPTRDEFQALPCNYNRAVLVQLNVATIVAAWLFLYY